MALEMNCINNSITSSSRVCRGCLAADVRLYDIRQNNLMEAYSTLLNTALQVTGELPHYLCSYCATLLLKCDTFRTKCIDSLKVLKNAQHNLYFTIEKIKIINHSTYLIQSEIENINIVDKTPKAKNKYSDISSDTDICSESDLSDISFDSDDLSDVKSDCTDSDNDRKPNLKAKSIKINTEHDNPPKSSNNVIKSQLRTYFDDKSSSGLLKDFKVNLNCESIKGTSNIRNKRMKQLSEIIDHIQYSSEVSNELLKILDKDLPNYENEALKSVTETNIPSKIIKKESKSDAKAETINEPEVAQTSKQNVQKDTIQDNTKKSVLESKSNIKPVIDNIEVDASLNSGDESPLSALPDTAKSDSKSLQCKKTRAKKGTPNYRGCKNIINGILQGRQANNTKYTAEVCATYNMEVRYISKEEQIIEINNRKESENYKNGLFKCNICFKGFLIEETYQNHMLLHDDISGKFVCDICQCHYMTKQKLTNHKRTHNQIYTCKECGYTTKHGCEAVQHYKWHNGKKHTCKDCGKEFKKESSIYGHIKISHPNSEQLVRCEICGDSFNGIKGLQNHDNKIHKEMRSPECYCSGCETQFYWSGALKAHQGTAGLCITTHKYCVRCGMAFGTEELLKEHETEQRKPGTCFKCEVCHKTYNLYSKLKTHQRRHSAKYSEFIKTYQANYIKTWKKKTTYEGEALICEVCGKPAKNIARLKQHYKLVHVAAKPFKCTTCSKIFKTSVQLDVRHFHIKSHIRVHTGERPFKCNFCSKSFSNISNKKRHVNVHLRQTYTCDICGKNFTAKNSVQLHIKTVHMNMPMTPRK